MPPEPSSAVSCAPDPRSAAAAAAGEAEDDGAAEADAAAFGNLPSRREGYFPATSEAGISSGFSSGHPAGSWASALTGETGPKRC